jgi:hypothetical protein
MSNKYLYYDKTGKITNRVEIPETLDPAEFLGAEDEGFVEFEGQFFLGVEDRCYITEGFVTEIPERPAPFMEFNYNKKVWIDPRSLEKAKIDKWVSVKKERDKKYREPFLFNGSLFQPDIQTIMAKAQVAQLDLASFSQSWVTADNHVVTLNGDDMIGMGLAIDARNSDVFVKSQQLRALIETAITNEQVDAITWDSV